jgi:outer membrane lipoprotein LolB
MYEMGVRVARVLSPRMPCPPFVRAERCPRSAGPSRDSSNALKGAHLLAARVALSAARRLRASSLALLLLTALAACKTLPPAPPESAPWEVRKAALQSRDNFNLKARIGVAVNQEGFNAKLRWQQRGKQSQLFLDGPLGVGGVRITSDGDSLKVQNSRGEQLDSEAAKQEIESKLGFDPPIASLRYWVLGVPDPSTPADEMLDDANRLATLKQDGWQIEYTAYTDVRGQALPSKATLTREGVRVRLFVDEWGS